MTVISLRNGGNVQVDDEDIQDLSQYSWVHWTPSWKSHKLYARSVIGGKWVLMHRLLTAAVPGQIVDHVNGDGLDNRKTNLRFCTCSENGANRACKVGSKTGFKGVNLRTNGRYRAFILKDYKYYHLGDFVDAISAAKAYNVRAVELYGEFARLNSID